MPTFDIVREANPSESFRVSAAMGMFDLQSRHVIERFQGVIDIEELEWNVGAIVGSSGTGKTTIAKEVFPESYIAKYRYRADSVLEDFPKRLHMTEITKALNAVGFNSPPSWLKPFSALSQGEQMRINLARALLEDRSMIVFDEFTSVVDRTVAKVASFATARTVRKSRKQFIAVSCHFDILEWLEPDWIFDTNEMRFEVTRGRLRRPKIKIDIREKRGLWNVFAKYHYLNPKEIASATNWLVLLDDRPIGIVLVVHNVHRVARNLKRISRVVIHPDFQGLGIGVKVMSAVAEHYHKKLYRVTAVFSNPALIRGFARSPLWVLKHRGRAAPHQGIKMVSSNKRITTSWQYIGNRADGAVRTEAFQWSPGHHGR